MRILNTNDPKIDSLSSLSSEIHNNELVWGFDQQFAERVKKVWHDCFEIRNSFQNDLDVLYNRLRFSFFLEGAKARPEGLSGTLLRQLAYVISSVGAVALFIEMARSSPSPCNQRNTALPLGSLLCAGLVAIPICMYTDCVAEARSAQFGAIVRKNFQHHLSDADCDRLTMALVWVDKGGKRFNLDNDAHLRGWTNKQLMIASEAYPEWMRNPRS